MITISDIIKDAQGKDLKVFERIVRFKRRFWDIENQEYTYESAWQVIPKSDILSISSSKEQIDYVKLNDFRIGNITIRLNNQHSRWYTHNPAGYFSEDDTARQGYEKYRTQFEICIKYILKDGTESEALVVFSGISKNPVYRMENKEVEFNVGSFGILLEESDAEDYSTKIIGETIGTGDGSATDFLTANKGVGRITKVTIDDFDQVLGVDYDTEDVDTFDVQAKIKFKIAPSVGQIIKVNYFYWFTNKKIEKAVEDLCELAGITNRDIDVVKFPSKVFKQITYNHTEDRFSNNQTVPLSQASPPWTLVAEGLSTPYNKQMFEGSNAAGTELLYFLPAFSGDNAYKEYRRTIGKAGDAILFSTKCRSIHPYNDLYITINMGGNNIMQLIYIIDTYGGSGQFAWQYYLNSVYQNTRLLGLLSYSAQNHNLTIYMKPGRVVIWDNDEVWIDQSYTPSGTLIDPQITFKPQLFEFSNLYSNIVVSHLNVFGDFGELQGTTFPLVGKKTYPAIDLTDSVAELQLLTRSLTQFRDEQVSFKTQTSDDDITYTALESVSPSGQIVSPVKRYLKVEIARQTNSTSVADGAVAPFMASHTIDYNTLETFLQMVNPLGLTISEAIEALAEISSYQWGFTRAGKFFFRNRIIPTDPVANITLTNKDILRVDKVDFSDVYNKIIVQYGDYTSIADVDTFRILHPNSRDLFGTKILQIVNTKYLLEKDANIARGTAETFFNYYKDEKLIVELTCKFLPQLEVFDVVRLNYIDVYPQKNFKFWYFGDGSANFGDTDKHYFGDSQMVAYGKLFIILAITNDLTSATTRLVLREV